MSVQGHLILATDGPLPVIRQHLKSVIKSNNRLHFTFILTCYYYIFITFGLMITDYRLIEESSSRVCYKISNQRKWCVHYVINIRPFYVRNGKALRESGSKSCRYTTSEVFAIGSSESSKVNFN